MSNGSWTDPRTFERPPGEAPNKTSWEADDVYWSSSGSEDEADA